MQAPATAVTAPRLKAGTVTAGLALILLAVAAASLSLGASGLLPWDLFLSLIHI